MTEEPAVWTGIDEIASPKIAELILLHRAGERAFELGEMARAETIHKSVELPIRIYEA